METLDQRSAINVKAVFQNYMSAQDTQFPFSNYITYEVIISTTLKSWTLKKRFSEFAAFHKMLSKQRIADLPKLPNKGFIISESAILDRKAKLQKYFNCLLRIPEIYKLTETFTFLKLEKELYWFLPNAGYNLQDTNFKAKSFSSFYVKSKLSLTMAEPRKLSEDESHIDLYASLINIKCALTELVEQFLKDLETNIADKCAIVKQFESDFNEKKEKTTVKLETAQKLLFGDVYNSKIKNKVVKDSKLKGLLYHCGNVEMNEIGAQSCVELLSKIINSEYSTDSEMFAGLLKNAGKSEIEKMNFEYHLSTGRFNLKQACFVILHTIGNFGSVSESVMRKTDFNEKYNFWVLNICL